MRLSRLYKIKGVAECPGCKKHFDTETDFNPPDDIAQETQTQVEISTNNNDNSQQTTQLKNVRMEGHNHTNKRNNNYELVLDRLDRLLQAQPQPQPQAQQTKQKTSVVDDHIPDYLPFYRCKNCNSNHENKNFKTRMKARCNVCGTLNPDDQHPCLMCGRIDYEPVTRQELKEIGVKVPPKRRKPEHNHPPDGIHEEEDEDSEDEDEEQEDEEDDE